MLAGIQQMWWAVLAGVQQEVHVGVLWWHDGMRTLSSVQASTSLCSIHTCPTPGAPALLLPTGMTPTVKLRSGTLMVVAAVPAVCVVYGQE
jgi:hypothetical protein